MKSTFLKVSGGLLVFFWLMISSPAQPMKEKTPPEREGFREGNPDKEKKGFREFRDKDGRDKEGREGRMRPEPFLIAGDPRFQKMLLLATTAPDQLEEKMKNWPGQAEMTEERKVQMKKEMDSWRNRIFRTALKNAEESGVSLSEEQKPLYVKRYWEQRSKVESGIREEVQARLKTAMDKENAALKKEFSPAPAATSR